MRSTTQKAKALGSTAWRRGVPDILSPQAAIAFLAESALSCLDIYALFDLAAELITEVLDAEFVEVLHQESSGEPLIVVAGRGWGEHVRLGETTVEADYGSQAGYTLMSGEPVLVEDLTSEERFEGPPLLTDHGVTSGISVVIPGELEPYGVLGVHTRKRRQFTTSEGDFLRSAANILGGAQDNIRIRLQIERDAIARERRVQYHAALARCAQALLASGGEHRLNKAIEALLASARASDIFVERNVMSPELGFCSRTVAEAKRPDIPDHDNTNAYWAVVPWERMPTTRSALEAGESIAFIPTELEGREFETYDEDPLGVASEIDVPIFVNGKWAGLIGLAERELVRDWTDEDQTLLAAAATMIGAYWERDGAHDALLDAIRSKDMFLASVSHELRNPLTAVVGSSELLRDESLELSPEERAELLDVVVSEGNDLVNIVSDLLAAAKADSGTLTVSRVGVNLRAQAAQVLEAIDQKTGTHIELAEHSVTGVGDPDRVRQIVRNLITNAIRYGGDIIRVELSRGVDVANLRVCDNGPGVAEGDRERVFEAYQTAHGVPGRTGSIGLGLAISRKLARLMGGDLTYRYQGGESMFELSLPVPD
jgi:signal transduction histidine kinase